MSAASVVLLTRAESTRCSTNNPTIHQRENTPLNFVEVKHVWTSRDTFTPAEGTFDITVTQGRAMTQQSYNVDLTLSNWGVCCLRTATIKAAFSLSRSLPARTPSAPPSLSTRANGRL